MRSEQGPEKRPVLEIGEGDSKEDRKDVRGRKDLILKTVERNSHAQTTRKHAVRGGSLECGVDSCSVTEGKDESVDNPPYAA